MKSHKRKIVAKIARTIPRLTQTNATLLSVEEPKYFKLDKKTASTISFANPPAKACI